MKNLKFLFVALLTLVVISSCEKDFETTGDVPPIVEFEVEFSQVYDMTYSDGSIRPHYVYHYSITAETYNNLPWSYELDFGDGEMEIAKANLFPGKTYGGHHDYFSLGTYTLTVKVTSGGNSATASKKIVVSN